MAANLACLDSCLKSRTTGNRACEVSFLLPEHVTAAVSQADDMKAMRLTYTADRKWAPPTTRQ